MTSQEFYEIIGYLSNPIRQTNIEAEMHPRVQAQFVTNYAAWTNNFPLPSSTTVRPYYVWAPDKNKYGLELRGYFISNENMPHLLDPMLEPRKFQNRPGYQNWKRRISRQKWIIPLLKHGFVLGSIQDVIRIRTYVPKQFINDFDRGFNL